MRVFAPLLALALAAPPPVQAQAVRRCVDASGQSVFTDRPCESLGAAPRGASAGATPAPGFAIRGCARTPRQLLEGVRGALEARDANRLANYYHWPGTGPGAARYLMDELERIASRPTVGLGYPDQQMSAPAAADAAATPTPALPADPPAGPPGAASGGATPLRTPPARLRVEQAAGIADATLPVTEFLVVRHADCWWISL